MQKSFAYTGRLMSLPFAFLFSASFFLFFFFICIVSRVVLKEINCTDTEDSVGNGMYVVVSTELIGWIFRITLFLYLENFLVLCLIDRR